MRWPTADVLRRLPVQMALVAGSFALYHLAVQSWLRATGGRLGAISARLVAPLHAYWEPHTPSLWMLPALVVVGAFLWVAERLFAEDGPRPAAFLTAAVAFYLALGFSVSLMDGRVQLRDGRRLPSFLVPYTRLHSDYIGDVPHVERMGVRSFLAKFAWPRLFDQLALHTRTHPPGGVLFHWLVARLGGGLWAATLASIGVTGLAVVLVYLLGRELHGEAVARTATALLLAAPNFLMYAFTSMDGVFAVLPLASLWLLARVRRRGRWLVPGLALAAAAALASFLTYAAAVFLAVFVTAWLALGHRDEAAWRNPLRALAVGVAGVGLFYAALWWWAGYDPVRAVLMSIGHDARMMGGTGYESLPRFLNLGLANVMAFLIGTGVALSTLLVRDTVEQAQRTAGGRPDAFAGAVSLTLIVLSFSTLFTLEVERVWLFLVPPVAIMAARHLHAGKAWRRGLRWALGVSAGQVLLAEALLRTDW